MSEQDPNEMNNSRFGSPDRQRDTMPNTETNQSAGRPYADAGNLYEIPRIRPDDPPMRKWWIDDEPQQDEGGSPQNN